MIENLVIVESPAKAKTIEKYLGKDFRVISSFGHIRDLKKKNLGIDINHDFSPEYEIPKEKAKVVGELKKAAAESKIIWLASDEDREGEAIAWHLASVLNLDLPNTRRIVFHEITQDAIAHAHDVSLTGLLALKFHLCYGKKYSQHYPPEEFSLWPSA